MSRPPRVAIVVSHPINYFCAQYASLARSPRWQLKVFFASVIGREAYHDLQFGQKVAWTGLRLNQFDNEFLSETAIPSSPQIDAANLDDRLASYGPDVVLIYGYGQKLQRRAHAWARTAGKRTYYISDTEIAHRPSTLKLTAKAAWLRWKFRYFDRFLTVGNSNEFFYFLCGVDPLRMTRMHFPIDVEHCSAAYERRDARRAEARAKFGIAPDEVVVVNVGKLVPWKCQRDLVMAAKAAPFDAKLRVLLVGSGPDQEQLRALADEVAPGRVTLAGFVPSSELPDLYAAADVYAHPSSYDPHALAISEALYMGLPVVLSDRCGSYGPHDDVRPGWNGLVYPSGDVDALSHALVRLAQDPHMRHAFGVRSHDYAMVAQKRSHGDFLSEALEADAFVLGPANVAQGA